MLFFIYHDRFDHYPLQLRCAGDNLRIICSGLVCLSTLKRYLLCGLLTLLINIATRRQLLGFLMKNDFKPSQKRKLLGTVCRFFERFFCIHV